MDSFFNSDDSNINDQISDISKSAISKFRNDIGKVNIIVAGITGAGKSTLINAIFNKELTCTGFGKPITHNIVEYSIPEFPISIIDTEGIGYEREYNKEIINDLKKYVEYRQASNNKYNKIHVAWCCIPQCSLGIGNGVEIIELKELVRMLSEYMPVILVITKQWVLDEEFESEIEERIKKVCFDVKAFISVVAKETFFVNGYSIPSKNLEKLVILTKEYFLEIVENNYTLILAQNENLELKEMKSKIVIEVFKNKTKDAKIESDLLEIGIRMITEISRFFQLEVDEKAISQILNNIFDNKKLKKKKLINEVLKFVPSINTTGLPPEQNALLMENIGKKYFPLKEY